MNKIIRQNCDWRKKYHYAVYEHNLKFEGKMFYKRSFIVLKNQYGIIVYFTKYHNYFGVYEENVCKPLNSDTAKKMHYACIMLNYIFIEHYERFKINHIFSVTKSMIEIFFQDYATKKLPNGSYRSKESIEKCIFNVVIFFRKVCIKFDRYMSIKIDELYRNKNIYSNNGKIKKKFSPDFQVNIIPENKNSFRDIPTKVFHILLNQAFNHTPEIAFAICLQAFAGLRPSEVCNVRQVNSPLGSGIRLTEIDGVLKRAVIDLTKEYKLRSDNIFCGGIKKERTQSVYPAFLSAFSVAYKHHMEYISDRKIEFEYCPMFVNSRGMAMTYDNYHAKFRNLIEKFVRPLLIRHEDPECQLYGQLLYENKLSPHSLRHWFSVQLVILGEDVAQIQFWRGDNNPESAIRYLMNKGDLIKELSIANNLLADFMVKEGGKLYGKSDIEN